MSATLNPQETRPHVGRRRTGTPLGWRSPQHHFPSTNDWIRMASLEAKRISGEFLDKGVVERPQSEDNVEKRRAPYIGKSDEGEWTSRCHILPYSVCGQWYRNSPNYERTTTVVPIFTFTTVLMVRATCRVDSHHAPRTNRLNPVGGCGRSAAGPVRFAIFITCVDQLPQRAASVLYRMAAGRTCSIHLVPSNIGDQLRLGDRCY